MAIFLAFYGFNGKMVEEGQSFVDLGTRQFDERFRFWDDVTDPRALGVPFDTEGTPKGRLDLVADGVTKAVAHNRKTGSVPEPDPTATTSPAPRHGVRSPPTCSSEAKPGRSTR